MLSSLHKYQLLEQSAHYTSLQRHLCRLSEEVASHLHFLFHIELHCSSWPGCLWA